ncbi:MAG: MATE family efflux transporter, partial [Spirochaetales bacterium]|nr:MATE family efflux transporter [Candidatus Physcosoma equi]
MGVAGVAIATVLSQGISAILVTKTIMESTDMIRMEWKKLKIHWKRFSEILYIGMPAGFQSILFSLSNVIIQSSINSFGSIAVAGNTAGVSLDSFVYMTNNAMAQTNLSFISQNYGAGKRERIFPVMRASMVITFLVSCVLGNGIYLFRDFFLGIYAKDSEVIAFGAIRLKYLLTVY